jgi:transposase
MERLLPPRPEHPLGCHNPRVPDRAAMDAIFFVLRTGCQWNALRELIDPLISRRPVQA